MTRFRTSRRNGNVGVGLAAFTLAFAMLLIGSSAALADEGVGTAKGCLPVHVPIGTMIACHYELDNTGASGNGSGGEGNTVIVTGITDTVNSSPSDVSGDLLPPNGTGVTLTGGATCGPTSCTLPPGATLKTGNIPFHTATAADYALHTNHTIGDTSDIQWFDTCDVVTVPEGCSSDPEHATSSSTVTIDQLPSNTVTAIQQGGSTVTSVLAGSSVTDQATVTGSGPTPTGTVTFTFFTSSDCSTGGTAGTPQVAQRQWCCDLRVVGCVDGGELLLPGDLQRRWHLHDFDGCM